MKEQIKRIEEEVALVKNCMESPLFDKSREKEYVGYKIVTFDEASFRLVPVYRRVWFIKGKRPKGVFFWSNKKINILCGSNT